LIEPQTAFLMLRTMTGKTILLKQRLNLGREFDRPRRRRWQRRCGFIGPPREQRKAKQAG
jgi:hypothetical protein